MNFKSISVITLNVLSTAIEKLIQARGETSPVLTSFDPIHSPTASKDPVDQIQANIPSCSPIHSVTNSAASTPSSSTKRSTRRRTMLFSSSVRKKGVGGGGGGWGAQ